MSERVRDVGDGLILAFPITEVDAAGLSDLVTSRLYFLRVAAETRYFQKYTALSSITSGSTSPTSGYDYLGDTGVGAGSDIFRMENDDWHLMHFGIGTQNPNLEVFYAISPNANGNPAQERNGTGEDITPGTDDRGWFSQVHIDDAYDPPALTERVSFRNDNDGQFLQFAFHNDGGATLSGSELHLLITGRGYKAHPVTDRATQDEMLRMAMSRPSDPTIDTIIHAVGGVNKYQLAREEPDEWSDVPSMHRDFTAEELLGGGERRATAATQTR